MKLLNNLLNELKEAKEIYISFFLYNNPYIHSFLEKKSRGGCKINIYSIPLSGYDQKPVKLYINKNNYLNTSKEEYGRKIYNRINRSSSINLKIFPHTYIWYKQQTSRGANSYSLHNKSLLAYFPNGETKCISTSCNFALGDPPHSENMVVFSNDIPTIKMFKDYFDLLDKWSINYSQYSDVNNHRYAITPTTLKSDNYKNCYFTAPFIKYDNQGSNHFVQDKIISYINQAKERILICGQHISDINSFDPKSKSIIKAIANRAALNSITIKVLKQTLASHQKQGKRNAEAEIFMKKYPNIEQRYNHPLIHDKFLIIDNLLIVTTANFTSTQYAWAENYPMKYINENEEEETILNTFSEINSFHFIDDITSIQSYIKHFDSLWAISKKLP